MLISYKLDEKGRVMKRVVSDRHRGRPAKGEVRADKHFSEAILRAYYRLECEEGSRFRSGFSKRQIKSVHSRALERFEQTGVES